MIKIKIFRNNNTDIYGFQVDSHGNKIICAAVSALAINTVNSIETYFNEPFEEEHAENGGYLRFTIPAIKQGKHNHDINLLLKSFVLGVRGIEAEHPGDVHVDDM